MLYKVTQCAGCVLTNTRMHLSQIPTELEMEKNQIHCMKNNNQDQSLDFLKTIVSTLYYH